MFVHHSEPWPSEARARFSFCAHGFSLGSTPALALAGAGRTFASSATTTIRTKPLTVLLVCVFARAHKNVAASPDVSSDLAVKVYPHYEAPRPSDLGDPQPAPDPSAERITLRCGRAETSKRVQKAVYARRRPRRCPGKRPVHPS